MKIKKIITITCLFIFISPAFASDWVELTNNNQKLYLDMQSLIINFNDKQANYWIKFNNNNDTYKMFMTSNCSTNQNAVQQTLRYSKDGKLLQEKTNVNIQLKAIVPDSSAEAAHNFVCDIYRNEQYKQEQVRIQQEQYQQYQETQAKNQRQYYEQQQQNPNSGSVNQLMDFAKSFTRF